MPSSGVWCRLGLVGADVSEARVASSFRRHVPPKRQFSQEPHGLTSQQKAFSYMFTSASLCTALRGAAGWVPVIKPLHSSQTQPVGHDLLWRVQLLQLYPPPAEQPLSRGRRQALGVPVQKKPWALLLDAETGSAG
jgi:hypothetical protein